MRRALLSLAALALAACGSGSNSSTGPAAGGATVASVTVTGAATSVAIGGTVQFTAVAKDASGNVMSGQAFTWSSSSTPNATVAASGIATGVAAGPVTISAATANAVKGSASLTVSGVIKLP